jgi:hypothetical protein
MYSTMVLWLSWTQKLIHVIYTILHRIEPYGKERTDQVGY